MNAATENRSNNKPRRYARAKARAAETKVAIPSPVERPARMRESNLPVGTMYGNRACTGWRFDQDRYAVQTRSPQIAKQLRRRKGAVLFADALVGDYMQTWLLPCRSEANGRKIIDQLLQCGFEGSEGKISPQILQREAAFAPQNYSKADSEGVPSRNTTYSELDWTWIEQHKPEAVGTEFCIAFARSDGHWAVQINDPRLGMPPPSPITSSFCDSGISTANNPRFSRFPACYSKSACCLVKKSAPHHHRPTPPKRSRRPPPTRRCDRRLA